MTSEPVSRDETLSALTANGECEPTTTAELAATVGVPAETLTETLDDLSAEGVVRSKQLADETRLWWPDPNVDRTIPATLFADLMAHELRNPLAIARLNRGDDAAGREAVTTALTRMEEMIDVLVTAAKGASARVDPVPVDVERTVRDVQSTLGLQSDHVTVETGAVVETEPHHLRYLLDHLCHNAVRHSEGGVTVEIGVDGTELYVADDGPGIPERERERVFEPGYSTTNDLGLGLTVVERLAAAYGWRCAVTESRFGGTRAVLTDVETGDAR